MPSTRLAIAEAARYQSDEWGDPQYWILWKGRIFTSGEPGDLVDQVQLHERLKESEPCEQHKLGLTER